MNDRGDQDAMQRLREDIDRLDQEILRLLTARSRVVVDLGHVKRRLGIALHCPERELEVLRLVTEHNHGPLDDAAVRRLFERIIDESRRIERLAMEAPDAGAPPLGGRGVPRT